jgi:hypothetical protein
MINKIIILSAVLLLVSACSDDDRESGDHVWKEQTQVLDKAKEVEGLLKDVTDQQRKMIDEQAQ